MIAKGDLLAVDPGLVHPGAAFLRDGVLLAAERVKIPGAWVKLPILDRCERVAERIAAWAFALGHPTALVVEWPQWYGETKAGGINPNDLAGLCGISGGVLARLRTATGGGQVEALSPTPHDVWGNLPKATKGNPWKSPRAERLKARLTPAELEVVAPYHDALDAAGLALFGAGRWQERRRVFPGAV